MASTPSSSKSATAANVLHGRLQRCWSQELNWDLFPTQITEACRQVGTAISMPPVAVLAGLLMIISFSMSHSCVVVEGTDWLEPVILWIAICMPTGSGKSSLCKFLKKLVDTARVRCGLDDSTPSWYLDDQSFEKMGAIMNENHCKLLGLYDELAMFLSQINVFRGRGLADSHELSLFLQLYGGNSWVRKTVSGDANFHMKHTALSVGGFVQPSVAKNLIEVPQNIEKGLCQQFLWICPKPLMVRFEELQSVNADFSASIVTLMSALWVPDKKIRMWKLKRPSHVTIVETGETAAESPDRPRPDSHFQLKYDKVQAMIGKIGCMDELLSGMLSKSKGQILRVSAVLHVLFHIDTPHNIPETISEDAVKAADNFVDLCLQQAAYLAGRNTISEALDNIQEVSVGTMTPKSPDHASAAFSLLLPGEVLHLSAILVAKKLRPINGNKESAVKGFRILEEAGLGQLVELNPQRGATMTYEFVKAPIPVDEDEKLRFAEKLIQFGISLRQYQTAFQQKEITMESIQSRKRANSSTPVRFSPRKSGRTMENN